MNESHFPIKAARYKRSAKPPHVADPFAPIMDTPQAVLGQHWHVMRVGGRLGTSCRSSSFRGGEVLPAADTYGARNVGVLLWTDAHREHPRHNKRASRNKPTKTDRTGP
ncbi:hypothetical protein SKAU_G00365790 [Synaphobranchus kaupii]|uniref:Uncharacterized protein n=1 Tax=Synaphobranchus kaupii TaxID=118154 RepID=A0A9Q1EF21_SYNKA|nr:hypothetical protein SKAU_G00365790 [Synaphobranchus kaupii]